MNQKRLARLAALRRRLRDQQSAKTAEVQVQLQQTERAYDDAVAAKGAFDIEAFAVMQGMRHVDEIWWLQRREALYSAHVERTAEAVQAQRQVSEAARAELREMTKDVRVAEQLLDRLRSAMAAAEQGREQRMVDDIIATEMGGAA